MADIVQLRIDLEDMTPKVWRRIEVPVAVTLADLHKTIQIAMGWTDTHLYEFRAGRRVYGMPDPNWDLPGSDVLPAKRSQLADVLAGGRKRFAYVYDLGDNWAHNIVAERIAAADSETMYPRLVEGEGCCPPEDVGGPPGYAELLAAVVDPKHERHDELVEWVGAAYDPAAFDRAGTQKAMQRFALRLARRKTRR